MVWIGGRRGRSSMTPKLILHDPPPGYRPPRRRTPLKQRQRIARRDWILEHVLAVILIPLAAALVVIIFLMIATLHLRSRRATQRVSEYRVHYLVEGLPGVDGDRPGRAQAVLQFRKLAA
jgi:hypothetical protein